MFLSLLWGTQKALRAPRPRTRAVTHRDKGAMLPAPSKGALSPWEDGIQAPPPCANGPQSQNRLCPDCRPVPCPRYFSPQPAKMGIPARPLSPSAWTPQPLVPCVPVAGTLRKAEPTPPLSPVALSKRIREVMAVAHRPSFCLAAGPPCHSTWVNNEKISKIETKETHQHSSPHPQLLPTTQGKPPVESVWVYFLPGLSSSVLFSGLS